MAQRTRKILLWDGTYTADGAFGDCNAANATSGSVSKELHVPPNVGIHLVPPKVGARIVRVDRFLDLDRHGRKPKAYGAITVDLKGIAAIKSLLLVVYPRPGVNGFAKPVYRELIEGNDKILKLIAGKLHARDADPSLPKPPANPVGARYRDTPFTVRVWVSTEEKIDVDALALDALAFTRTEEAPRDEKFPALAHDKRLPHPDDYRAKRGSHAEKRLALERNWLGWNQISCPLHEKLKLVYIQTTHTAAMPPIDRANPEVREKLDRLTERVSAQRIDALKKEVAEAKETCAKIEREIESMKKELAAAELELKAIKESGDAKIAEIDEQARRAQRSGDDLDGREEPDKILERQTFLAEAARLRDESALLKKPREEASRKSSAIQGRIAKKRVELEEAQGTAGQDTEIQVTLMDRELIQAHPEEYRRQMTSYFEGIEDRSQAPFDHHVLRKVPMGGACPTCETPEEKLLCMHRLDLERFTRGSTTPEPCARTSLTVAQKEGDALDKIGAGGTTRTSFDEFMSVFCDHDGGADGALSPIDGLLLTITDDNYAHNVAAAVAYKALIQRGDVAAKRLVINFDQHVDCGDNSFVVDDKGQVKITCATWGQFMYYESPDPAEDVWKDKLKTPFAPRGKPIAHGYVAVGTMTPSPASRMNDFQSVAEGAKLPVGDAFHELLVNPAAAVLRRSDGTPGGVKTVIAFGEKTFKGDKGKRYQLCDYRDLMSGADVAADQDPNGVERKYYCPKCVGAVEMTSPVDPKQLVCPKCVEEKADKPGRDSRQGIEDVFLDIAGGETDWSKWHVFITIDRDFFIGNGTGWNDGRNGSHNGRDLVLKCMKYLVEKKAKIVGLDICGVPDQKGVATSRFLGARAYELVYAQLAEDVRTFCLQLDEMMYAADEGRAMELLGADATWKIERWTPTLALRTPPPAPKAPAVLRHDGYYVRFKDGDISKTLLRFYPDGVVIAVTVEHRAPLDVVGKWFHRDSRLLKPSSFKVDGANIAFSHESLAERPIDYRGTMEGDTLVLLAHSHINGLDYGDTFYFTPLPS